MHTFMFLCVLVCISGLVFIFFFKQKTAYEMRISDWSSDVCSSDLSENTLSFESDGQAVDALEAVLEKAVQGQMISDVALGAFLSGGIDSSVVVVLMQKSAAQAVRTLDRKSACRERGCQYV